MMETKFTPGPWSVGPSHVVARRFRDGQDRRVTLWVSECVGQHDKATIEANANLIAAAPELYEALSNARAALWAIEDSALESGFGKLGDIIADLLTTANTALARARGEQS